MSTIIGYFCTNSELTSDAIQQLEPDFTEPESHSAMGFAWVQEGRTLTRKQPTKPGQDLSALSLMSDIPSRSLVGQIDTRDVNPSAPELQPYGFREWVWAEAAKAPEYEKHAKTLREQIPDYIDRNIEGESFSEALFHRFMAILHTKDGSTPRKFRGEVAASTVEELYADIDNLDADLEPTFQFTAASDRLLVAGNFGQEAIKYRLIEGIEKEAGESLFSGHKPKQQTHPRFRALFVSNGIDSDSDAWKRLDHGQVLTVDKDWDIDIHEPLAEDE